uniref:Ubiquinol-cytochrome c reductase core protein 2b n=1 Tax=Seriola dumerili TaxID=41447 RepID=A0A3B4TJ23_SERDU
MSHLPHVLCFPRTRLYAAQAARKGEFSGAGRWTKLPSGLVMHRGVIKAGSNEYWLLSQPGADVHFVFSQTTQRSFNLFKICRGVEAVGGSAAVSNQERCVIAKTHCHTSLCILINILFLCSVTINPERTLILALFDCLRDAIPAWRQPTRTPLSNSLYCPTTCARMVLWGLVKESLMEMDIKRNILSGTTGAKAQYRGGEAVWHSTSSLVHSAVVSQSAAAGKQRGSGLQCAAASTGSWVHMSRGDQTSPTKLVQGVAKATADPFDSSVLSILATLDSGLFGVYTISQAAAAGDVSIRHFTIVAYGGFCLCLLFRAQLRGQFLMSLETSEGFLEALATQALTDGTYISPRKSPRTLTICEFVVNNCDLFSFFISRLAKKFMSGKRLWHPI